MRLPHLLVPEIEDCCAFPKSLFSFGCYVRFICELLAVFSEVEENQSTWNISVMNFCNSKWHTSAIIACDQLSIIPSMSLFRHLSRFI
jgi:hypothetical protein